jgi:hypothetical protein
LVTPAGAKNRTNLQGKLLVLSEALKISKIIIKKLKKLKNLLG